MSTTGDKTENATENEAPEAPETQKDSIADAAFDVAEAWIAYGLGVAKGSLEASAKTLEKTAKAIETLRGNLLDKAAH